MDELVKCNTTNHVELNKTYECGGDEDSTERFQAMWLITSSNSEWYSGIWNDLNNTTLLGTDNYPITKTSAYDVLCRYKK